MSGFGGPGAAQKIARPTPPERGSFPLDHDGECKHVMTQYLRCMRAHRGEPGVECRELSKGYLQCRMDNGLMAVDEMRNLGFVEVGKGEEGGVGAVVGGGGGKEQKG